MTSVRELKKVIRALLLSSKQDGISLREFEKSFKEQEGRNIPLHGFANVPALLNSMTDTVYTVKTNQTNNLIDIKKEQERKRESFRFCCSKVASFT